MALYQSALSLGGAIGPAVGGPLAEQYDWRAALLFCVVAGLVAIGLALPMAMRGPRSWQQARPARASGWAGRRRSRWRWCCCRTWQPSCSG